MSRKSSGAHEARSRIQEIVADAASQGADSVSVEFAKEGGLEVCFVFGNSGVGRILIEGELESKVMGILADSSDRCARTGNPETWSVHGRKVDVSVEQYESFGEYAYTLTIGK